jgi:hypothetical protein
MVFTGQDKPIPLDPCKPLCDHTTNLVWSKIVVGTEDSDLTCEKNYISPLSECFFSQIFPHSWSDPDPFYLDDALSTQDCM